MTSDVKKIAHNGKFDIKFIQYHWNITVKNFWVDTMLLHYLLDENKKHIIFCILSFKVDNRTVVLDSKFRSC